MGGRSVRSPVRHRPSACSRGARQTAASRSCPYDPPGVMPVEGWADCYTSASGRHHQFFGPRHVLMEPGLAFRACRSSKLTARGATRRSPPCRCEGAQGAGNTGTLRADVVDDVHHDPAPAVRSVECGPRPRRPRRPLQRPNRVVEDAVATLTHPDGQRDHHRTAAGRRRSRHHHACSG